MRLCGALMIGLACGLVVGCQEEATQSKANKNLDAELVNTLNNIGVENAIITQHTLYPYHFVTGGEQLNDLGQRDFAVLAKHFTEHPGVLNIRRGEVSAELYNGRVAYVVSRLKEAGVEKNRVTVSDEMPGGTGMSSERVVTILQKETQTLTTTRRGASSGMITQ